MADTTPDIEGAAKAKVGKFPVWLIAVAIVGGGALLLFVIRSRSGGSTATTDNPGGSVYSTSGIPSGSSSSDTASDGSGSSSATGSNTAWLTRATAGVSLSMAASPTTVYGVLYNFLNGGQWLQSQQKYIDRAINDYGMPPEGTIGIGSATADPVSDAGTVSDPTPSPAPAAASVNGYIRERGTYNTYATYTDGSRKQLSTSDWIAAGRPDAAEVNPFQGTTNFDLPIKYLRQRLTYDLYAQYEDGRIVPITDQQWRDAGSPNAEETNMFAGQEKKWM